MSVGILAEFAEPQGLVAAVTHLQGCGYRQMEAFSPHPVPGLALGRSAGDRIGLFTAIGALCGGALGYAIQAWTSADYPLRVGAMPVQAWPAFIPITFESAVLAGVIVALVAWAVRTGLPRWWDELFEVEGFTRFSVDRFFLLVEVDEAGGDAAGQAVQELNRCQPVRTLTLGVTP